MSGRGYNNRNANRGGRGHTNNSNPINNNSNNNNNNNNNHSIPTANSSSLQAAVSGNGFYNTGGGHGYPGPPPYHHTPATPSQYLGTPSGQHPHPQHAPPPRQPQQQPQQPQTLNYNQTPNSGMVWHPAGVMPPAPPGMMGGYSHNPNHNPLAAGHGHPHLSPPPQPYGQVNMSGGVNVNMNANVNVNVAAPSPMSRGYVNMVPHAPVVGMGGVGVPAGGGSRQKKILSITDKHGKPVDLTDSPKFQPQPSPTLHSNLDISNTASSAGSVSTVASTTTTESTKEAGNKLREAAERAIKEGGATAMKKKMAQEAAAAKEKERLEQIQLEQAAQKKEEERLRLLKMEEEKAAAMKQKEEEEERARILKAEQLKESNDTPKTVSSLSSLKARLDHESKEGTPTPTATPAPTSTPTTSLRPGGTSLRPGGTSLRPGGASLRPGGASLRPGGATLRPGGAPLRPGGAPPGFHVKASGAGTNKGMRRVFSKAELLRLKDLEICCCRPPDLRDMTITSGGPISGGGGGGNRRSSEGGGNWARKKMTDGGGGGPGGGGGERGKNHRGPRRENSHRGGDEWGRNKALPRQKSGRGGRGGRGGDRGGNHHFHDDFDGPPPAPLLRTENRWVPVKDTSAAVITDKKVKSILNKMTKEKFEKLAHQMCELPISSYEMLTKMIHHVYEKAIYEPAFGSMYAELCVMLSHKAKKNSFVKIIESDEEPPTEDGTAAEGGGGSSGNTVYRWSNDVNTDDAEIVGPFTTPEECLKAALNAESCPDPIKRDGFELNLYGLKILQGMFIKIMQVPNDPSAFYTVFFPMRKSEEIGQQMSKIFLSERECVTDGTKKNGFKRILLNKCEDEFNKQDIYVDWKKEKKEYEERKGSMKETERLEQEEELEFRRMNIKKQMLGNIRFIGELFKQEMLKEKIMKYCVLSLLKLEETNNGFKSLPDDEMDEEDHEAVCKLFTTIGSTIDHKKTENLMKVCFKRMAALSNNKRLNSRSRFMYKDLIELRQNNWVARREEETAKTLDEIKKDFEREEYLAAQQAQQAQQGGGYRGGTGGRGGGGRRVTRGGGDYRDGGRKDSNQYGAGTRQRPQKERRVLQKDEEGFTPVYAKGSAVIKNSFSSFSSNTNEKSKPVEEIQSSTDQRSVNNTSSSLPLPLSQDKLKIRVRNILKEFMQDRKDLKNLFESFDELSNTSDAGKTLVQVNLDAAIESKDDELDAIIEMISLLFNKGKLSETDIEVPMADIVEFVGDFVVDSPMALKNVARMLAVFLYIKALNVGWLCSQTEMLREFHAQCIPELIGTTIDLMKKIYDANVARAAFNPHQNALNKLLGTNFAEINEKLL